MFIPIPSLNPVSYNLALPFLLCLLKCLTCHDLLLEPVVTGQQGPLKGTIMDSVMGRPFSAFRGIPYAKPPLAHLRFKAPLPADSWGGVFDATQDSVACSQLHDEDQMWGQEDCLTLNVYTPKLPVNISDSTLPVLVFIHPGGFMFGAVATEFAQPQRLMDKDVVFVTITYRLGVFGFLSTNDEASYGNYGLFDQLLALKWVHNNIHAFGGDADRVTLWGQSAGAASVVYHMISPQSQGLFQAGILQSGSPLCPWAFQKDPLRWAILLANEVNCSNPSNDTSSMVECLRGKTALQLIQASNRLGAYDFFAFPFVPVAEGPRSGAFLTKTPMEALREGNFPNISIISGVVKDEMASSFSWRVNTIFKSIDDAFFQEQFPAIVQNLTKYDDNLVNIANAVKDEYFDGIDLNDERLVNKTFIDMLSDVFFKAGNDMTVRLLTARELPVYSYVFDYVGNFSSNETGEFVVSHEDDLEYLFNRSALAGTDLEMSHTFMDFWINFTHHLKPTPSDSSIDWTPTPLTKDLHYLAIEQDSIGMEQGYLTQRMEFWNEELPTLSNA